MIEPVDAGVKVTEEDSEKEKWITLINVLEQAGCVTFGKGAKRAVILPLPVRGSFLKKSGERFTENTFIVVTQGGFRVIRRHGSNDDFHEFQYFEEVIGAKEKKGHYGYEYGYNSDDFTLTTPVIMPPMGGSRTVPALRWNLLDTSPNLLKSGIERNMDYILRTKEQSFNASRNASAIITQLPGIK